MKSHIPLRYYLSFHFGVAAILPAIAMAGLIYFVMMPDTRERTKIQHQAMADVISGQVSAYLEGGERQIKALAAYLGNHGIQPGPKLTGLLDAQCGGGEFFETLFIFNNTDAGIQAVGLPIVRRPNRDDLVGLDLSGRSFIKNIKETGQTFLSKTFLSMVSNRLAVALAAPLPNGFLIGEITLDKLSDFIRGLPAKSGFVTMVVDGEGIVVADPMKRHWGQILDFNYTAAGKPDRGKDNAILAFELDGEKMLGTLIDMNRIGWKVLVAQPARKVFEPLGKIFSLLAWGMAATLGLVLALSWLLAGRFAGLFTSYTNSAESIARGSYNLDWPRTKTRESVRMSQSLARMAEKISQREKDLRFTQFSFDKAAVGILYIRSDGSILKVNEHAARMLGYTAEEMAQLSISDIDADANAESLDFAWRKLVEDRVAVMETFHLRKDGSRILVEVVSNFLEYENQQFSVCFVQDISERKQMEDSLRLTQFIFDKAPIGIWRIGPEGEVLDVNEAGCASLGYTREELCRMSVADFDPNYHTKVWASIIAKLKTAGTITIESLHQRKSGESFPIQIVENLVRYEDQEIHVAFIQDISERKQAEEELRLASVIFNKAPIGIWITGKDGEVLDVNEAGCASLGYTKEELCHMTVFDFNPGYTPEDWAAGTAILNKGNTRTIEVLHRRKSGELFPIQVIQILMRFEGRELRVGFVQDITERKRNEEALRKNEQLLTNILESMDEAVSVVNTEFVYQLVNKKYEEFTAKTRQESIGKMVFDVFPDLKRTDTETMIRKVMKGETISGIETRYTLNQKSFWVKESLCPLKDADDRVIGVVDVASDITRQKQDELELRRLRNYLSNIIDSMPSILVAVDRDGLVTQWNNQTERVTGLDFDRVRSQPLVEVFPPLADEMERIQKSILERRVINDPKVARKVSDETRYEDITIFPLTANGVEGAVIRVDDVTERVRMEEMMIQSEKMLSVGGLAAGMAHEINNPLAGMMQTAEVMSIRLGKNIDIPANRKAAENAGTTLEAIEHFMEARGIPRMIEAIITAGQRVAAIVDNMLNFARKSDATVSSHILGDLLDRAVALAAIDYDLKKQYDFKQIEIQREYEPNLTMVPCEEAKIQQVLLNILRNGAEAMQEAGTEAPRFIFRTRTDHDTDMAVMEIEDNGPGIDELTRKRIFEPFFTTKPVGVGTGLGLSVSYFIITESHGGQLDVKSSPGAGATFTVRLPMKRKSVE